MPTWQPLSYTPDPQGSLYFLGRLTLVLLSASSTASWSGSVPLSACPWRRKSRFSSKFTNLNAPSGMWTTLSSLTTRSKRPRYVVRYNIVVLEWNLIYSAWQFISKPYRQHSHCCHVSRLPFSLSRLRSLKSDKPSVN